jgi:hypothetical protein
MSDATALVVHRRVSDVAIVGQLLQPGAGKPPFDDVEL